MPSSKKYGATSKMNMSFTVQQAFNEFGSRLELSQSYQNSVTTHHNAIRRWIESFEPDVKTILIGSLQRKTRIQPRPNQDSFDIDILVVLGSFQRWVSSGGISPWDALHKVEDVVSQNTTYRRMGPETDSPAIIVEYSDNIKVELVPAYLDQVGHAPDGTPTPPVGRGYWIPKSNGWAITDYEYDAAYVSIVNQNTDGYLIPVIKMLKAAKRNLFSKMMSFHLEVLATSIIPAVIGHYKQSMVPLSYPHVISGFFFLCKDEISKPASIPGSKSQASDTYMTTAKQSEMSRLFEEIASYCANALSMNDSDAIKAWRRLFGPPFPAV